MTSRTTVMATMMAKTPTRVLATGTVIQTVPDSNRPLLLHRTTFRLCRNRRSRNGRVTIKVRLIKFQPGSSLLRASNCQLLVSSLLRHHAAAAAVASNASRSKKPPKVVPKRMGLLLRALLK